MLTRFAPSPTGRLHLGHAYAALVAHELASRNNGACLLRFEDIDHTRSRPRYYTLIEEDLRWLGLHWQGKALRQSERLRQYTKALDQLRDRDVIYPCFCNRRAIVEEVARMPNAPHGAEGVLYPGTCRRLSDEERSARIREGRPHAWRLDSRRAAELCGAITFKDLLHGTQTVLPGELGDVVLARRDIATSYHLAVVVDDAEQGITLVTRSEDLLAATHVHRLLQVLLAYPEPQYLHHEIIRDETGKRLATRDEALSLASLRESGITACALLERLPPVPACDAKRVGRT
ncbi:MAG: tRNA glutamyl-Q(34) synthetase GluQRS [Verrucomicrobiaceae bacterium]|nr:tRNA glutamyl-Q(34) synthetase GluQRS [Verrucomicrobiaceae bacterium]